MDRSKLIIQITDTTVQIDNLEVRLINLADDNPNREPILLNLSEARRDLAISIERLKTYDRNWITQVEQNIQHLQSKAAASLPGEKAKILDEIEEYKARIEKRKKSMENYG